MQRLKKTIKRMAAIGTGFAMLGATITGAVAQDLGNYPQPFIDANGVFNDNTAIVVGAEAAASDTLGAVDIAQRLQFDAKTPVSGGGGTVKVAGGVTEDIPLMKGIANSTTFALAQELDDGDIENFIDTEINFQSEQYDVSDRLVIEGESPIPQTSLSSIDDDYESNMFLEVEKEKIKYYMFFDEPINISKATSTEPLELKFLGKTLKITKVDGSAKFTANVGSEFFMDAGDTVTVDGKKITLVNVGEGGAIVVDVDGVLDTISSSSTRTINGIEIKNDETFYTNEKSERSASLIIGKDAVNTFDDEDAYPGEDEVNPDWRWSMGNLAAKASTTLAAPNNDPTGPFIGVFNADTKNDDSDDPAGVGECYDLPNNYASVCLDSLTVADDDYLELTISRKTGVDTALSRKINLVSTSANVFLIETPVEETMTLRTGEWNSSNFTAVDGKKVNKVYLQPVLMAAAAAIDRQQAMVFYEDKNANPTLQYAGNISFANQNGLGTNGRLPKLLEITFGDTKNTNAEIRLRNDTVNAGRVNIMLNFTGDSTSELQRGEDTFTSNWTISAQQLDSLGITLGEDEIDEFIWEHFLAGSDTPLQVSLGRKDEDHRGLYGAIIKDPKSNGASERLKFQIPGDQVQTNIVVKGSATSVSGGTTSYIPANIDITTRLDSEISGSERNFDLILVGGPCANNAVGAVSGLGLTCETARAQWSPGQAVLKMASNGENVALLVAGFNAIDTRTAARVLKNYEDFDLAGSEVKVTGTPSNPVVTAA